MAVFTRLGGTAAMADWAKEHLTDFYRMYAQLAPKEIDAAITVRSERDLTDDELIAIASGRGDGTADTTESAEDTGELH